jgi:hypothetical protein
MALINTLRERRRAPRLIAVAALALLAFTGTASAKPATTRESAATCDAPLIEQPFLSFKDKRNYVLAPGGSFEDGLDGWTVNGGAGITGGNEPFNLRRGADQHSLSIPSGGSATSPMMCVDLDWPTMRFVAKQGHDKDAELSVEVLYPEAQGKRATWHEAKKIKSKLSNGWRATDDIKMSPQMGGAFAGGRPVALRFTNDSDEGSWQIDNVYVDPKRR